MHQSNRPRTKSLFWAVMLQCVPLLGAAGCVANGTTDQRSVGVSLLLWTSVLLWGLGYLYVGAFKRLILAVLAGPVLAITACSASFSGVSYDYEHGGNARNDVDAANRASIQTGAIIALAVMVLAVDAARLAVARNANEPNSDEAD